MGTKTELALIFIMFWLGFAFGWASHIIFTG